MSKGIAAKGVAGYIRALYWMEEKIRPWSFILLAFVLLICVEVAMRYFFNKPHDWFEEVSIIVNLWFSLVGCALVSRHRRHINLNIVYVLFSPKLKNWADGVSAFATFVVSGVLAYFSLQYSMFLLVRKAGYGSSLGSSFAIPVLAIFVGMLINCLFSLAQFLNTVLKVEKGGEEI